MKKIIFLFICLCLVIPLTSAYTLFNYQFNSNIAGLTSYNIGGAAASYGFNSTYGGSLRMWTTSVGDKDATLGNTTKLISIGSVIKWTTAITKDNGTNAEVQIWALCNITLAPGTNLLTSTSCVDANNLDTTGQAMAQLYNQIARGVNSTYAHYYINNLTRLNSTHWRFQSWDKNTTYKLDTKFLANGNRWFALGYRGSSSAGPWDVKVLFMSSYNTSQLVNSNFNCTSCNQPYGDATEPYSGNDTTPTFRFRTNSYTTCRIAAQNLTYGSMGSSRDCTSGQGSTTHTCTLIGSDELYLPNSQVYVRCNDELNFTAISRLQMNTTGLTATSEQAIDDGIKNSTLGKLQLPYTVYTHQNVYLRNLNNMQAQGIADRVVVYGNQRWILNYVASGESPIWLFNLTPAVYSLEMYNLSNTQISLNVKAFINSTKR